MERKSTGVGRRFLCLPHFIVQALFGTDSVETRVVTNCVSYDRMLVNEMNTNIMCRQSRRTIIGSNIGSDGEIVLELSPPGNYKSALDDHDEVCSQPKISKTYLILDGLRVAKGYESQVLAFLDDFENTQILFKTTTCSLVNTKQNVLCEMLGGDVTPVDTYLKASLVETLSGFRFIRKPQKHEKVSTRTTPLPPTPLQRVPAPLQRVPAPLQRVPAPLQSAPGPPLPIKRGQSNKKASSSSSVGV